MKIENLPDRRSLEKNDIIELSVEGLGINGEGIARIDGLTVFIKGALPGERVRAKVILVKPSFAVARLQEILTPSPHRVQPVCPVYGKCGGCTLQHLSYTEQLVYKQKTVKETLKKVAGIDIEVEPTLPSDQCYGYRNKISLPIRSVKGEIRMGFFMPASHNITFVTSCPLQKPEINRAAELMHKFLRSYGGNPYDETTAKGDIRHLVVRSVAGKLYVTVVVNEDVSIKGYERLLRSEFKRYALYKNYNADNNNVILGKRTVFLGGDDSPIDLGGLIADVHPAGFFQVNDYIRDEIYALVKSRIATQRVVDAYSGAGLMTARIAPYCREIYGIEINPDAHNSAIDLKKRNGIENMHPMLGDSGRLIGELVTNRTTVILDPPRSGCDEAVTKALRDTGCPIIYVSCNPATLSRDIMRMEKKITFIRPFDMFPQTSNVETVAVLE